MAVETSTGEAIATAPVSADPWPAPRQAWYTVFIFALTLMINFLDRGIITLLVPPIKADLGLSDFQLSIVMGFAFVLFYLFMGLPIARLADVGTRRTIIGVGIALWSAATALCGLAQNFWQLFICRMGTGVGEACNGPATFSMLADLFPREKLPRAIAVLNFGFMAGTGLSLIIGGAAIHLLSNMPPLHVPAIGLLKSWQLTFIFVGLPGLVAGTVILAVWPSGAMFGSWLAERWQKQGHDDANLRIVICAIVLLIPGQVLLPLMPRAEFAVAISAIDGFIAAWVLGPQNAAIQIVTPNEMRGQVTALMLFIFNVIGFGMGPTAVATLTDYVFGEAHLRYALSTTAIVLGPLAGLSVWWGLEAYGRSVARAQTWS